MTMPDRLSNYRSLAHRLAIHATRLYELASRLGGGFPTPEREPYPTAEQQPLLDDFAELNREVTFALDKNEAVLAQLDQLLNSNVASIASAAHGGFAAGKRAEPSNSRY